MIEKHELPIFRLKIQKGKSLMALVKNSIRGGDNYFFRNLYAKNLDTEEVIDILENGKDSCAAFVSWILIALELLKHPHASVEGTEKDLIESGWFEIKEPRSGAILFWEKESGQMLGHKNVGHRHIGFYIGDDMAISNGSSNGGFPMRHHYTYNKRRKIEKVYWHKDLDEE